MTAYTPRFRGVADGDAGDLEVRGTHRLLRLPDTGPGDDAREPRPAVDTLDMGEPPEEPPRRPRPRRQDATVLHLPPDGRDGRPRRSVPAPPASASGVASGAPDAQDFDDRPLRSRRSEPIAAPPVLPPPSMQEQRSGSVLPPRPGSTPSPVPHDDPLPPGGTPPRDGAPPRDVTLPREAADGEHRHARPRARHADAPAVSGPPAPVPPLPPVGGAPAPVATTGPVLFGRRETGDVHPPAGPAGSVEPAASARATEATPVAPVPPAAPAAPAAPAGAARSRRSRPRTRGPVSDQPDLAPPAPPAAFSDTRTMMFSPEGPPIAPAGPPDVGRSTRRGPRPGPHGEHPPAVVDPAPEADEQGLPQRARAAARHRAAASVATVRVRTRAAVLAGSAAAVLLAVLLWIADGGPADLLTPALAVDAAGSLAGMVGSALLAVLVVLAAGIPAIERAFGRARLLRWHVTVGAVSFSLVAVHVFLAVAASALVEGDSAFEAAWRLLSDFPGITLAAFGVALLVLVVSTSRRAARASRRRDAWHMLHLYGYLGVFLALPHQVLTSPLPAALYWSALYLVAAGAVIGWRVYLPLARSLRHQLVVSEIHQDSGSTVTVVLRGRRLDELAAVPGSTLRLRFLDGRGWFAVHPGSVIAGPTGSLLRVTVPTTTPDGRPGGVAAGTWVLVEGPYGVLTADARTRPTRAVFAAGTGIAPVRALLEDLPFDRGDVVVVHRVHDAAHAPFAEELAELADRRGVETVRLDGPRPEDRRSWLPASAAARVGDVDAVTHLVADIVARDVFISGPPEWVGLVADAVRGAGVPASQVHADSFAW